MRYFMRILLAGALSAPLVPVAFAFETDPISISTSSDAELPLATEQPFDWSGFYAGIYSGIRVDTDGGAQLPVGVTIGGNAQSGLFVLGADMTISGLADPGSAETAHGQILGRAGMLITDDVMVYAAGGYGIDLAQQGEGSGLIGGGLELSLTESVSVRAQYMHEFSSDPAQPANQITLGANFHF